MTLCPIALAVGCRKCPAFAVCPLKGVIGDQAPGAAPSPAPEAPPRRRAGAGKARADAGPRNSKRKAAKRR
jgi:hypothetical protein